MIENKKDQLINGLIGWSADIRHLCKM